jgi:hypothetical protein
MKSNPTTPSNPSAFEFQTEAQLLDVQELTAAQNMNVSLERRNAEAMQASALGRDELERRLNKPIRLAEQKLAELKAQVKGSAHHLKMIKEALQKMAEEALRQPGSAYDLMVKAIEALSFRKTEASLHLRHLHLLRHLERHPTWYILLKHRVTTVHWRFLLSSL